MSYRDQLQDTDYYDGWGDDDSDPRDYSQEGQRVSITTQRFPASVKATIAYRVAETECYALSVDSPGAMPIDDNPEWWINAYALRSEITF